MNLFISVLIENFEQVSIKNDLVQRLSDLKKPTLTKKIVDFFTCKKKVKQGTEEFIDKMIDQKAIDEAKRADQELFE